MPSCPALGASTTADVCIVGAGIAGLTTAYLLTQAGKSVVVLDDGPIACGMTAVTSAHLSNAIDARYCEIERMHGEEGARVAAASHTAAIDRIENIVRRERIACDFSRVDGYLFHSAGPADVLARELEAARRAGLATVADVPRAPLAGFDTGRCLRFAEQAEFHPLKYLARVVKALRRDGCRVFANTHVDAVRGGARARIESGAHAVKAGAVVVATNTPINDRFAVHTKQAPYMTYVVAARVPRGSVEHALYWDTDDPYHYVRVQSLDRSDEDDPHDLLIVGGEDHKTGQADDTRARHTRLEAWARERFPAMGEVDFAWAGQVMETIDGLAFIGRNPLDDDNVYIATGDCGMGLTHGTIAGMLLTDLILGRENPWAKVYDPARKTLRAAGEFARENLNVAAQYGALVSRGDVRSVEQIPNDCGAVLRRGISKVAVYRDEKGKLHEYSALCPHLGCVVAWNAAERTWDCPCHGSRFDRLGRVINGPANRPLKSSYP